MATKERAVDRGARIASDALRSIGRELRDSRVAADLSQRRLGAAVGTSASAVSRIERGLVPEVPLGRLSAMAAVLGLELSLRAYPVGQPLRDRAQLALLGRLRGRIHASLGWDTEVVLPIPGDLRAWDARIRGSGWVVWVDAETRIRDAQAIARRVALKRRDSPLGHVVLAVADTRSNRAVLRAVGGSLVEDATPGGDIVRALIAGREPPGSGVVLI